MNNCPDCKDKSCAINHLNDDELTRLKSFSKGLEFKKGELIVEEKSRSQYIYYIRKGIVKEFLTRNDGKEKITRIIKSPSYLGIYASFGGQIYPYSLSCIQHCHLCRIDIETFKYLIRNNGAFSHEILSILSASESTNYHQFIQIFCKQISGRVADSLLYFADKIYLKDTFRLDLNRTELASLIGSSRETVTRILYEFQNNGIIELNKRSISIKDKERLLFISRHG